MKNSCECKPTIQYETSRVLVTRLCDLNMICIYEWKRILKHKLVDLKKTGNLKKISPDIFKVEMSFFSPVAFPFDKA